MGITNPPNGFESGSETGAEVAPAPTPGVKGDRNGKIAKVAADLVFYTDTNEKEYPIYVTSEREVWVRKRPYKIVDDRFASSKVNLPVAATFYVTSVEMFESKPEWLTHPLLERVVSVMREVTKADVKVVAREITYEVYAGDIERLVGSVKAHTIHVYSARSPFSCLKHESSSKAYAVVYNWRDRVIAKLPEIEKFIYVKSEDCGRRRTPDVFLAVKLPVVNEEFERVFNMVLAGQIVKTSDVEDLEKEIRQLEELIKQKEAELVNLKERLEQLKLKLQLEKTLLMGAEEA